MEQTKIYFTVRMLQNTDHFSTVKPTGFDHPAHKLLVEFWLRHYGLPFVGVFKIFWKPRRRICEPGICLTSPLPSCSLCYIRTDLRRQCSIRCALTQRRNFAPDSDSTLITNFLPLLREYSKILTGLIA